MAWLESHTDLRDHPKTKRAAKLLGIRAVHLVGHLHFLWWWCLSYAQDGDLSQYDDPDVAEAAAWEGDPQQFVNALLECGPGDSSGFLERGPNGRLLIHDWWDYAGKLVARRQANAERMRAARRKGDGESAAHVQNTVQNIVQNTVQARAEHVRIPVHSESTNQPTNQQTNHPPNLLPRVAQEGASPPDLADADARLWNFIRANFSALESVPANREQVLRYAEELGPELVLEACRRAVEAGKRSMAYVRGILERWSDAGAKSLADVAALDAEHEDRKQAAPRAKFARPQEAPYPYTGDPLAAIKKWDREHPEEAKKLAERDSHMWDLPNAIQEREREADLP